MKDDKTGLALRYFRKKSHLTQVEVSDKLNKSQQWISDFEKGKTSLLCGDIKKLCSLYHINPSDLEEKEKDFE